MGILAGGPLTGVAMNPARHFGTAIIGGDPEQLRQMWVYWAGPLGGGLFCSLLYHHVVSSKEE
ncbi:MAG: aquaporin [Verrucomicrobiota bacterium]